MSLVKPYTGIGVIRMHDLVISIINITLSYNVLMA